MVAPALYGQFNNLDDINIILNGLLQIGFDDVFEVSRAAELVTAATKKYMKHHKYQQRPIISTACPAVLELILVRFHSLADRLLPMKAPVDIRNKPCKGRSGEKGREKRRYRRVFHFALSCESVCAENGNGTLKNQKPTAFFRLRKCIKNCCRQ